MFYINDFVNYVKKNSHLLINFSDIIIDDLGRIYLATPSHIICMQNLIMDKYKLKSINKYFDDIPIFEREMSYMIYHEKFISVYYNFIFMPNKLNRFQKNTLNILIKNKIIHPINIYKYDMIDHKIDENVSIRNLQSFNISIDDFINIYLGKNK